MHPLLITGLLLLISSIIPYQQKDTATLAGADRPSSSELLAKTNESELVLPSYTADTIIPLWPEERIPCANDLSPDQWEDDNLGLMQTKIHRPELHLFRPFGAGKSDKAVVICPGGGYYLHAWEWEGAAIARAFNQQGITAAVLKYRLPHWESDHCRSMVALADAQRGMQLMRFLAKSEDFATEQVGIMGFSAGGHLAASTSIYTLAAEPGNEDAVARHSSRPDFSILVYPVISMDTIGTGHAGSRRNLIGDSPTDEMVDYFSLEKQVKDNTPPAILFHAADDEVVPARNSMDYFTALNTAGVPAAIHVFEEGGHGFGFANTFESDVRNWWQILQRWLEDH